MYRRIFCIFSSGTAGAMIAAACFAAATAFAQDAGTVVRHLPAGYHPAQPERREYRLESATLRLYARAFSQGEAVYLELEFDSAGAIPRAAPLLHFEEYAVHLSRRAWGYRGLFPIAADSDTGAKTIQLRPAASPLSGGYRFELNIVAGAFPVSHAVMDVGRFSDVDHARPPEVQRFIARSSAKKAAAFARHGPDLLSDTLAHPRDRHHVTSAFWSSRVYERFEMRDATRISHAPSRRIHRGVDLRGNRGEPVFALADGEVILADSLYYEGNFTLIDHGNRIMSYYMHQDSLLVRAGQRVRAGQQIGTVGATGVSTAPHLHISLTIDRVQVDPLSILSLPLRQ